MSVVSPDKAQRVAVFIDVEVGKRRYFAPMRCFPISFSTLEYKSRGPLSALDQLLIGACSIVSAICACRRENLCASISMLCVSFCGIMQVIGARKISVPRPLFSFHAPFLNLLYLISNQNVLGWLKRGGCTTLLFKARELGVVSIRRAFGDFSNPSVASRQEELQRHGFDLIHTLHPAKHKSNSADIRYGVSAVVFQLSKKRKRSR